MNRGFSLTTISTAEQTRAVWTVLSLVLLVGVLLVLASTGAVTDGSEGDADSVAIETEPGTQQTVDETITSEDGDSGPSVKVTDQSGDPVEPATVYVEVIDGPGSNTSASSITSQTDSDGIATFNNLAINEPGDYRLEFSIDSAAVSIAESASVESQDFTVTPPVDRVELDRTGTQTLTAGKTLEFSATAFNESDDVIEDDDSVFTWAETTDDGTFTSTTAGEYDVTATYGVETSPTTTVMVEPTDPDTLSVPDVTGIAYEHGEIDAILEDEYGNTVSDESVTVTSNGSLGGLPIGETVETDEDGVATFTHNELLAGVYELEFELESNTSITDSATVTVEPDFDGAGTVDDPYQIADWIHLHNVRAVVDDIEYITANYTLVSDLDEATPGYDDLVSETANDGDGFEPIADFDGEFDGEGNTIEDLYIDRTEEDQVGLFASTEEDAEIRNLQLENVDVTGGGGIDAGVGSLVGFNEGDITNVSTSGEVTGDSGVGGLVGQNRHEVSESYAAGNVSGDEYVGGLVGFNQNGEVSDSSATGSVNGTDRVGGLVGINENADVNESYATGSVDGSGYSVGGLVGDNYAGVSESYATGSVNGTTSVGGLIGYNGGEVNDSYATGSVECSQTCRGLIALNDGDVEDSYWDSETTEQDESDGSDDEYGLMTAEMTGLNATENMAGFEFPDGDGTWHATEDYPTLSWESTDEFYGVNVTDTNSPVQAGNTLEVTADVTNFGADGDEHAIELLDIEDAQQDTKDVALESGESTELTLFWESEDGAASAGDVVVTSPHTSDSAGVTIEEADELRTINEEHNISLWDNATHSLRASDSTALTVDNLRLNSNDVDGFQANNIRPELNIYETGNSVTVSLDEGDTTVNTSQFDGDVQVLVAQLEEETDAEAFNASEFPLSTEQVVDEFNPDSLDSLNRNFSFSLGDAGASHEIEDGKLEFSYAPSDPGIYGFVVDAGDGLDVDEGEGNITSVTDTEIVGVEQLVAQDGSTSVSVEDAEPGDDVTFDVDTDLAGGVDHTVVLYDEETLGNSNLTRNETAGIGERFSAEDVTLEHDIKRVNGVQSQEDGVTILGQSLGSQSSTGTTHVGDILDLVVSGAGAADGGSGGPAVEATGETVLDASAVALADADGDVELSLETHGNWSDGEYRWVHVASGSASQEFQMNTDTLTLEEEEQEDDTPSPPPEPTPEPEPSELDDAAILSESIDEIRSNIRANTASVAPSETLVTQIGFDTANVDGEIMTRDLDAEPNKTGEPVGLSVAPIQIAVPDEVSTGPATIELDIPAEMLDDVNATDLTVQRFINETDGWDTLETEVVTESTDGVTIEAETPGFSFFSVTAMGTPEAVIDAPTTVSPGEELTLNGSNSSDEYGEITAFNWTIGNESAENETVTTAFDEPGDVPVELAVTNDANETATENTTITVRDEPTYDLSVVVEDEAGDAVSDATVTVGDESLRTDDGTTVFENRTGNYSVTVSAEGFENTTEEVTVTDNETLPVTLVEDAEVGETDETDDSDDTGEADDTGAPDETDDPDDTGEADDTGETDETEGDADDEGDGFSIGIALLAMLVALLLTVIVRSHRESGS